MQELEAKAQIVAGELGIELVDVRISRIELPEDVSESVYQRMRAERSRTAKDFRARGQETAENIRAQADKKNCNHLLKHIEPLKKKEVLEMQNLQLFMQMLMEEMLSLMLYKKPKGLCKFIHQ